ncbi:c-type cytochrome [Persephonella sp.]
MRKLAVASLVMAVIIAGCESKKETSSTEGSNVKQEEVTPVKTETEHTSVEKNNVEGQAAVSQEEKAGEKTTEAEHLDGEAIFKAKGCASCHQPSMDTVGPSLKKIAQAYGSDKQKLVQFLKGNGKPVVDPEKFGIMAPQLNTTKSMSDKELSAMADYILGH